MRQFWIIILVFGISALAIAQDMHFSQYYEHHALVNPALTGSEQELRAVLGYRSQWKKAAGTAFKSFGTNIEGKVLKGSWEKPRKGARPKYQNDVGRLGAGLSVYNDKIGSASMGLIQLNGSVAAFIPVSRFSFLSAGMQAGWGWRRMDGASLVFPNQYRPGGYDSGVNSGENLVGDRYRYFDLSSGVMWAYGYSQKGFYATKTTKVRIGAAAYHLTTPSLRVIGNAAEDLRMKFVFHSDVIFSLGANLALNPNVIFQMQSKQNQILAGCLVKYYLVNNHAKYTHFVRNTSIDAGLSYRNKDALSIVCMYETGELYAFGLSYDLTVSKLRNANNLRGGPEIMIRYTPNKLPLPSSSD